MLSIPKNFIKNFSRFIVFSIIAIFEKYPELMEVRKKYWESVTLN